MKRDGNYFLRIFLCYCAVTSCSALVIEDGRYKGVTVTFSSAIKDGDVGIDELKLLLSRSSEYLFQATRRTTHFSEFIFIIPSSWSLSSNCKKADILSQITQENSPSIHVVKGSQAKTQHSRGCGKRGDIIYIPSFWLKRSLNSFSRLPAYARRFVQLWATFRYGVFEETSENTDECYTEDGKLWLPVGCHNLNITAKDWRVDNKGLPKCSFEEDFLSSSDLRSSLMFSAAPPNMTEFCDGKNYPHNPIVSTPHNILCNGLPIWKVIEENEDFIHRKNLPKDPDFILPKPLFRCYHETNPDLFITIQNFSVSKIADVIKEIKYVLLRFLLYGVPLNQKVTIVTYSNEVNTDISKLYYIDASDKLAVIETLKDSIRIIDHIDSICIPCGIRRVIKVANTNHGSKIIIFMALVSDLKQTSSIEVWEELKTMTHKFYLIAIQDTEDEVVSADLVDVVNKVGGKVFVTPSSSPVLFNMHLNMIFAHIHGSAFNTEDKVAIVHQRTFFNIESNFEDNFVINKDIQGQLLYTLRCNEMDRLKSSTCVDVKNLTSSPYDCGILAENNSTREWKFSFKYLKSPEKLICTSLATVQIRKDSEKTIFRGFLSKSKITPKDALVVYVEALKNFEQIQNMSVEMEVYHMTSNTSMLLKTELRDNGNGDPDIKKSDGIYSRYLPMKFKKGMYSTLIEIKKDCVILSDDGSNYTRKCHQFKILESFVVLEEFKDLDLYPPNRILDLSVHSVDHENKTVTLTWTAPGDDYDFGQAAHYVSKYSKDLYALKGEKFLLASNLVPRIGYKIKPSSSGMAEIITYLMPFTQQNEQYFVALRAVDNRGNYSGPSNIVQIFLMGNEKPTSTEPEDTTLISEPLSVTLSTNMYTLPENSSNTGNYSTEVTVITVEATTGVNSGENCINKGYFITLVSAVGGGCLLLIIIINIVVCIICFRKRKKHSNTNLMLSQYNMDTRYKENDYPSSTLQLTSHGLANNSNAHRQETIYEQAFPMRENLTNAIANASLQRKKNNNNYADYREIDELARVRSAPLETHPGDSVIPIQSYQTVMNDSQSSANDISVNELGFV